MAFVANCTVSMVLEALCVTRTVGFLLPEDCWPAGPPQQRHADWRLPVEDAVLGAANSKFEIRNSKSSRVGRRHSEFRIPNSEIVLAFRP